MSRTAGHRHDHGCGHGHELTRDGASALERREPAAPEGTRAAAAPYAVEPPDERDQSRC